MFEKLHDNLISFLSEKISDPANRKKTWIYPGYPRPTSRDFPRISVLQTGLVRMPTAFGKRHIFEVQFDIDIWCKQDVIVNNATYKPSKLREYLGDKVIEALLENKDLLLSQYKIIDVIFREARNHPVSPEFLLYRKTITIGLVVASEEYL
jgi:hypothetical protein